MKKNKKFCLFYIVCCLFLVCSCEYKDEHPECIFTIFYDFTLEFGAPHDGKEQERTYQFIFFDGETLGKYTLSEIAERNLYDDLQILTFDQLRAAGYTVTYSGPTVPK